MTKPDSHKKSEIVGLTVYDLPSPESDAVNHASRTRAGRFGMLLVLLICAAPVLMSYLTYYVIRPQTTSSYGELIEPQRELPPVLVRDLQGNAIDLPRLKGQWLFLMVSDHQCASTCEDMLFMQRQLHKGLGKERDKVERVWLISDQTTVNDQLIEALQGATILRIKTSELSQWLYSTPGKKLSDHFYLIDPMGRWMMRFPASAPSSEALTKIKRDLERLLRAANSWDKPGRSNEK